MSPPRQRTGTNATRDLSARALSPESVTLERRVNPLWQEAMVRVSEFALPHHLQIKQDSLRMRKMRQSVWQVAF